MNEDWATVDTRGLWCPEPLIIVRNKVREMASGDELFIQATDPSTHRDFTNFCKFMGHELVKATENEGVFEFVIRKG